MKIKSKIIVLFLCGALLPTIGGGVISILSSTNALKDRNLQSAQLLTRGAASRFSSFFERQADLLQSLAAQPSVRAMNWEESSAILRREIERSGFFEKIILARPDGSYWVTNAGNPARGDLATADDSDPAASLLSLQSRSYFKTAITSNTTAKNMTVVSEPVISLSNKARQLLIAVPIIENGHIQGLIAGSVTWSKLNSVINAVTEDTTRAFGNAGRFMLFTKDGTLAYHWDSAKNIHLELQDGKEVVKTSRLQDEEGELGQLAPVILENPEDQNAYRDRDGNRWEIVWQSIKDSGYTLCVLIPDSALNKVTGELALKLGLVILGGTILILGLGISLARNIAKPVQRISSALKDVAQGEGDLTQRINVATKDEIGDLAGHFNTFVQSLRASIVEAGEAARDVAAIGEKLTASAAEVRTSVEEITQSLSSATDHALSQGASVVETSSAVHQISKNIESLAERIEAQAANVVESSASIEEMVGNIKQVTANLERSTAQYEMLVKASRIGREKLDGVESQAKAVATASVRLEEANEAINSVASQTNLLAMNAAIEAAHAGEAGKGFSVVADEIRKLAENSSAQSHEIADNLKEIQAVIDGVVLASAEAGTAFGEIEGLVGTVDALAHEVLQAMSEQTEGGVQVLESLRNMQDITTEVRDGAREMREGSKTIIDEMSRLQDSSMILKDNIAAVDSESTAIARIANETAALAAQNGQGAARLAAVVGRFKV